MHAISVSYDSRAIVINGQRTIIYSGSIHYPRSTPAMWTELLQRSREAGLNTIDTYVFWNLHERQRGIFDFSDRLDLLHFLQLAQEQGFHVILRIGPYICAEINYGGFPQWLRDVPGIRIRTLNEPYMREMERWVRHLVEYIRPMLASNGGPIILAQMENEYNLVANNYGEEGQRYLQWAAQLGQSLNLGIPIIMCVGAAPGIMETINGFYAHHDLDTFIANHPNQPAVWTECWTSFYHTFGTPYNIRTPENLAYATARFFAAGGTGINYYMWHGGTNFDRESMYLQTTSYDFNAPLDEYGFPTTKLRHLARLHRVLQDHSHLLLSVTGPHHQHLGEEQHLFRYAQDNQELLFLCNDAQIPASITVADQQYDLPAHSVQIINQNQVLYNSATVAQEDGVQRTQRPNSVNIHNLSWYPEPLPEAWPAPTTAKTMSAHPVEQLSLTHDTTDYCWYTTSLHITSEQAGQGTLKLTGVADMAHIFVDGQFQTTTQLPLIEERGPLDGPVFTQSFPLQLAAGEHTLQILCCAVGLIKGDWMLGHTNMAEERKGIWGSVQWNEQPLSGEWSMQPGLLGEQTKLYSPAGVLAQWQAYDPQTAQAPLRWWRIEFSRTSGDGPLVADLHSMNKGIAWLNGRCIGRYWLVEANGKIPDWLSETLQTSPANEPSQRYYHLPAEWLQEQNVLVLFEELAGNPEKIGIYSVKVDL